MKHQHRVPYRHLEISTGTSECFWFGSSFVLSLLAVVSLSWIPSSSLSSFSLSSLSSSFSLSYLSSLYYLSSFSSSLVHRLHLLPVLQRRKTFLRLSQRLHLHFLLLL